MTTRSATPSSARHRAREVALQTLFALDLQQSPRKRAPREEDVEAQEGNKPPEDSSESAAPPASALEVFESVAEHFEMPHAAQEFARNLVIQIVDLSDTLDEVVSRHAKNWRISRMAVVDRNILRLATFELAHTETAAAIVINEAVELARRFGSDESPPFVNGVLDAVARKERTEEFK